MLLFPWGTYRAYHIEHHASTATKDDPEGVPVAFGSKVEFLLMPLGGLYTLVQLNWYTARTLVGRPPRWVRTRGQRRDIHRSAAAVVAFLALVVVGARALHDHPERALGSTSLRVLQGARVPTLVVPAAAPNGTAAPRLRHVLVGVDRSPASLAALEVAAELAGLLGGSLSVVEAFPLEPPFPLGSPAAGPGSSLNWAAVPCWTSPARSRGSSDPISSSPAHDNDLPHSHRPGLRGRPAPPRPPSSWRSACRCRRFRTP